MDSLHLFHFLSFPLFFFSTFFFSTFFFSTFFFFSPFFHFPLIRQFHFFLHCPAFAVIGVGEYGISPLAIIYFPLSMCFTLDSSLLFVLTYILKIKISSCSSFRLHLIASIYLKYLISTSNCHSCLQIDLDMVDLVNTLKIYHLELPMFLSLTASFHLTPYHPLFTRFSPSFHTLFFPISPAFSPLFTLFSFTFTFH